MVILLNMNCDRKFKYIITPKFIIFCRFKFYWRMNCGGDLDGKVRIELVHSKKLHELISKWVWSLKLNKKHMIFIIIMLIRLDVVFIKVKEKR